MSENAKRRDPPDISNFDRLPDDALISIDYFAALLDRSVISVRRDVKAGKLPEPQKMGPQWIRWRAGIARRVLRGEPVSA